MNLWPFGRETRADSYTDEVVRLLESRYAGDSSTADPMAIAAVEIASGLWGRSFASAKVLPETPATQAVSPGILETIGRQLIKRRGECLFLIQVENGRVRLDPASSWKIEGRPDPATWTYDLTLSGPSVTQNIKTVAAERIVHCRYGSRPSAPWKGVGPLQSASLTALLGGNLEQRLGEELSMAAGAILPVPDGTAKAPLQADLRAMKGKLVLVDSTASGWGSGTESAPRGDLTVKRVGADPPAVLDLLRSSAGRSILAATGTPLELVEKSEGGGARESYRRFLFSSLAPVARLVGAELGRQARCRRAQSQLRRFDGRRCIQSRARSLAGRYGLMPGCPSTGPHYWRDCPQTRDNGPPFDAGLSKCLQIPPTVALWPSRSNSGVFHVSAAHGVVEGGPLGLQGFAPLGLRSAERCRRLRKLRLDRVTFSFIGGNQPL